MDTWTPSSTSPDPTSTASPLDKIDLLLADCDQRLATIAAAHEREMSKPALQRRRMILVFLDRERAVYSYGALLLQRLRAELSG